MSGTGPDGLDDLADQPGAVLVAAAERARAVASPKQLIEQVTVALFDVHEVEPDRPGQPGRRDVVIDQAPQLVVGQDGVIGSDLRAGLLVGHGPRVEDRVVGRQDGPRVAVPARVR